MVGSVGLTTLSGTFVPHFSKERHMIQEHERASGNKISLKEAVDLVVEVPDVVYNFVGEPGIGKSSIMKGIQKRLPNHLMSYVDCSNLDLGDVCMPVINHELRVTEYFPNSRFKLHTGNPVVILLDEFSKAMQPVKNMLHPLLERHNPRLGDISFNTADNRVIITGNKDTDGVGDSLQAHTRNRIVTVEVAKPTAKEWLEWAADNDIDPMVMTFVNQFPQCMASYDDESESNNPYIFNPKQQQVAFWSPRSAELASNIMKRKEMLGSTALRLALEGAVGRSAAAELLNVNALAKELPKWDDIIENPATAKLPSQNNGAGLLLIYGAMHRVTKETMPAFMKYLRRFDVELQSIFCFTLSQTPSKHNVTRVREFAEWNAENQDLFRSVAGR